MAIGNGKNGNGQNGLSKSLHYALPPLLTPPRERLPMGTVVRGSLQAGIQMKLTGADSVEDIRAGKFVVVDGVRHEFFAMITDVTLDCVSPRCFGRPASHCICRGYFFAAGLSGDDDVRHCHTQTFADAPQNRRGRLRAGQDRADTLLRGGGSDRGRHRRHLRRGKPKAASITISAHRWT